MSTNLLEGIWDEDVDSQMQWSITRDCMLQACNEMLGRVGRKQSDWFTAAQSSLQPPKHFLAKAVSFSKNM